MNLNDFLKAKQELQQLLSNKAVEFLDEIFEPILKNDLVKEIRWTQYTPYWNDGEACVFRVYSPVCITEKALKAIEEDLLEEGELRYNGDMYSPSRKFVYGQEINPCYEPAVEDAWNEFLQKFNSCEEILESAFGDHVQVSAYLKNSQVEFEIEEFDHE